MSAARLVEPLLRGARDRLMAAGIDAGSAAHDARALLAHRLRVEPSALFTLDEIPDEVAVDFDTLVDRRAAREPLQHLTGRAWFRRVALAVGPGVFVPRPETELLAGWAVAACRQLPAATVVDLGTGSGAIAAAIADEVPTARVHAVELSEAAAGYAARNLAGTGVDLRVGDLADAFADLDGTVDVVTANPPYIPLEAWESVAVEARDHDPDLALFSGPDGLDTIRVVAAVAGRLLRPGGLVGCEHADVQGESVPAVFAATGAFTDVVDHRDLNDRPRFTTARRVQGRRAERMAGWGG